MAANLRLVVDQHLYTDAYSSYAHKLNLRALPLNNAQVKPASNSRASYKTLATVVGTHVAIMFAIFATASKALPNIDLATPMMVSLVSQPSSTAQPVMPEPPKQVQPTQHKPTPRLKQEHVTNEPVSREVTTPLTVAKEANSSQSEIVPASPAKAEETTLAQAEPKQKVAAEPTIEPPRFGAAYLNNPAPEYPSMSRRQGEQGRVVLKVLVSENGLADQVMLEATSGHDKLDHAAIEAVKKWSFVPAKRNNQAVSAYVLVPVRFSLNS